MNNKVCVVIPCYNDGMYLKESIESVKKQTYSNIEIIVIDDGSTDKITVKVLENLDSDITVIRTNNKGPANARNIGINNTDAKYILPLDADDKIAENYIEKAVSILEKDETVGVVYCQAELFGELTGRWQLPDYSLEEMLVDNIVFVTALFRKSDWVTIGGFSEDFKSGIEDYDFWLSMLELDYKIIQIPEVLFYYRIKKVSRTTMFNENHKAVYETYDHIFDKHKNLYNKYFDIYCKSLRRKLIGRIIYVRQLEECLKVKSFFDKFPKLKSLVKKIYRKLFR